MTMIFKVPASGNFNLDLTVQMVDGRVVVKAEPTEILPNDVEAIREAYKVIDALPNEESS